MRKRNARTSSFLGLGGRGNSPPQWDGNFLLFYYLKKIFSIDFLFMGFCWVVGWGMRFRTPPKVRTRFIAFALWGVGGNAEVGRFTGGIRWVVGGGVRFRTPPKCADAVHCVRALGGGRKRRGGMAVCLKGSDSKERKPLGDKQSCWGLVPEQTPLFGTRWAVVGGRLNLSRKPETAHRVRVGRWGRLSVVG